MANTQPSSPFNDGYIEEVSLESLAENEEKFVDNLSNVNSPQTFDEQTAMGSMTDPSADDDVLLMSKQVGLRLDEDYENPKPLNIAQEIEKAEKSRRGL